MTLRWRKHPDRTIYWTVINKGELTLMVSLDYYVADKWMVIATRGSITISLPIEAKSAKEAKQVGVKAFRDWLNETLELLG